MKKTHVAKAMVLAVMMVLTGLSGVWGEGLSSRLRLAISHMEGEGLGGDRAEAVVTAMQARNMGEEQALKVLEMVRRAHEEGVPPGALLGKAEEGLAKGVTGDQVVAALERVRHRYRYAGDWARDLVDDQAVQQRLRKTVADAMAAGMEQGDLERVRERLRIRNLDKEPGLCEETALAFREMVRSRVRSAVAQEAVAAALEGGYGADDMARFRKTFTTQARKGDGEGLARRYTHAIRNGASASELGASSGHSGTGGGGSSHGGHGSGNSGGSGNGGGNGNGGGRR